MKLKLLVSLILLATLCSCGNSVSPSRYKQAETLCENNSGLHRIEIHVVANDIVQCRNGATFYIGPVGQVYNDIAKQYNDKPRPDVSDIRRREDMKNIDYDIKRVEEETKMLDDHMKSTLK